MPDAADPELGRRIGQCLRRSREARGLTRVAVARRLGISYQQLRKYEAGDNRISASMLFRLCGLLKLDLGRFFAEIARPDGGGGGGWGGPADAAAEIRAQLSRVADPLVRQRLETLLVGLGRLLPPRKD